METIAKTIGQIMTATLAQPMKEKPIFITPDFGFSTFGEPDLERMLMQAQKFCQEMKHEGKARWLTFLGSSGAGKTFLSRKIFHWAKLNVGTYEVKGRAGEVSCLRDLRFFDWRKCCDKMRQGEWDIIDAIEEQWFAVIDDVGAEYDPTGMLKSKLDRLCNSRLNKWTIYTSNFLLPEIADKVDVRIASRMKRDGNIVVEAQTTDFVLRQ